MLEGGAMMGKDYMLAIIIVNYEDNIWTDQNLLLDPDLPFGWRTIKDSTGTYYWHVPTGATQWQHPRLSGSPELRGHQQEEVRHQTSSRQTDGAPEDRSSWHENDVTHHDPNSKGREMMLVLKKDTLTLLDLLDHTPLHCQPIINIRVWGVGCNNGRDRDFAFVAGDKDSCMLKCHVFRCDAPAKAIATALHNMCSKMMSEKVLMRPTHSQTMESSSPEDLPRQVEVLEVARQQVQRFEVQYIGNLPVSRAMGMEVLNKAIESIMNSTDRDDWEPAVIHIRDNVLSLCKGHEGEEPFWECQVRFLTFLGVGHDSHTFAIIIDGGTQRFECHVFWCEPDAGIISEAVQAACMVQYQKCLVAQTPPPRLKSWRVTSSKVKRANSVDGSVISPNISHQHVGEITTLSPRATKNNGDGGSSVRRGMLAFFESLRNKQATTS
ncbi:amyloid-beta A4 precursor protein-binding family B member 2 isoform X3 [Thalassophryne amazonica]|uniref:amyloid-beta A4 precursor protein-binding family B member 2 isoform X3 n=1 Tax=Thalassophryne amazonica TaxID=390379 RepID=UPI0014714598|nr:amyloid-beta A4 precursor protein-binding family B member 2 isoform X3 [Thalassophryne amazonica]